MLILDISSNNPHPIDFAKVKAAGISGMFIKATQGTGYVNEHYHDDVAACRAAQLPALGYHYKGTSSASAEAAHFFSVAGTDGRLLDVEMNADVAWMNAFLSALPLPPNEEITYGSASTLPRGGIRSLLFPASYGRNYGFGDCWQFTDKAMVPGINGGVDESTWLDSAEQFNVLFGLTPPTPGGGRVTLNAPIVSVVRTPSGKGYWEFGADGGVFSYGDAGFHGSMGGKHLNKPVVAAACTTSGAGYWMVAADGGVFAFGDAPAMPNNPLPGVKLAAPITSATPTPTNEGLWLAGADGGIFALGDAKFLGRAGA